MAKQHPYEQELRDVEELWEQWPGRKVPADPGNMFDFFMWGMHERPDVINYRESKGDEVWQEIKYRLHKYERWKGRERTIGG